MSAAPPPLLVVPPLSPGHMNLLEFLRTLRENSLATYSAEVYEREIITRRLLWRRNFVVNEPDAIKRILLDNAANYRKSTLARRLLEPGLGRGLLTSEGETWRRHRRIMAPSFDPRSVVAYAPLMTEVATAMLARWDALPPGAALDVATEMMHATLLIISRAMFSSDSDDADAIAERCVERYQAEMRPGLLDIFGAPDWVPRLSRANGAHEALREFDRVIDRLLGERERGGDAAPPDLLSRLMAVRDAEAGGMTAQEVRDQVVTIFMAGHETTALALTWTWYLLSLHPEAEEKLHAEIDAVLGDRAPQHEDLARLPYTRMVLDESLRLYPPAHTMSRQAIADDELVGRRIPARSTVLIVPWVLHRHRRLWERPEQFDPERFSPERAASRPRFAYLPFGAGPRICIGAAFAITEGMLILATVAQRYRLRLVPEHPVEPLGLITLRSRHGMRMTLARRHPLGKSRC